MGAFEYQALDARGKTVEGVISADSARIARKSLRDQNLVPILIEESSKVAAESRDLNRGKARLKPNQLMTFTRQLSALLDAALPLEDALNTLSNQMDDDRAKRVLVQVRTGVLEGQSLSKAMAADKKSFPNVYRALIAAGEASGSLDKVLERLATDLEREMDLKAKISSALIYPAALLSMAVLVIGILITVVLPKLADQFTGMGQELPLLTRIMLGVADGATRYGVFVIIMLFLAGLIGRQLLKDDNRRRAFDRWRLKIPLYGSMVKQTTGAGIARTLGTMIESGAPVVDSLSATAATVKNSAISHDLKHAARIVREGASLAKALKAIDALPPVMIYMAAVGERGSQIGQMLSKAAGYLERDIDAFIKSALSLLEPAIIVIMGGLVALIVLSIMLPILQLNTFALT